MSNATYKIWFNDHSLVSVFLRMVLYCLYQVSLYTYLLKDTYTTFVIKVRMPYSIITNEMHNSLYLYADKPLSYKVSSSVRDSICESS